MKIFDITHPLGNRSACWPGDTPFQLEPTCAIAAGDSVNLSQVRMGLHNGTHADAPCHYDQVGAGIDQVPLDRYMGPALLVALEGRPKITLTDIAALELTGVERLLVRTGSCPDPERFNPEFTFLVPEAVRYLAELGVRLIGTDAHSVDPTDSQELPAHHACRAAGMLILENLNLSGVPAGAYELIALPLKLQGADGSPVRAILRGE